MSAKIVKSQEIVNSSQVKKVALTEEGLVVTFAKGTEYLYKGVTDETYEAMLKAESVGKFLNSNIKGKFDYIQLPVCPIVVLPQGQVK